MELSLQFGYGMMDHSRHLIESWSGGAVILSPRDLNGDQLQGLADDINKIPNGSVYLDPQFYLPRSDHPRLIAHDYWPGSYDTSTFFSESGLETMITSLWYLNEELNTVAFILPGLMATTLDDSWLNTLRAPLEITKNLRIDVPIYSTIALGADVICSMECVQDVLEAMESVSVDGVFILTEHPNDNYLVEDPNWLANVLELCAGLRLLGKKVLVGYINHEFLCLGAAAVNTVASGTWMNLRMFSPDRYKIVQQEAIRRRAAWYYAPIALTEYKKAFLDTAWRQQTLSSLTPPNGINDLYSAPLFTGVQPSSTGFSESDAFRHYLDSLHYQVRESRKNTFDDTLAHHRKILDDGEHLATKLSSRGVLSQGRGFEDIFDVVRSALTILERTRGPTLRRAWSQLT